MRNTSMNSTVTATEASVAVATVAKMYGRILAVPMCVARTSLAIAIRRHQCFMLFIWMINWRYCSANLALDTINNTVGILGEPLL